MHQNRALNAVREVSRRLPSGGLEHQDPDQLAEALGRLWARVPPWLKRAGLDGIAKARPQALNAVGAFGDATFRSAAAQLLDQAEVVRVKGAGGASDAGGNPG